MGMSARFFPDPAHVPSEYRGNLARHAAIPAWEEEGDSSRSHWSAACSVRRKSARCPQIAIGDQHQPTVFPQVRALVARN